MISLSVGHEENNIVTPSLVYRSVHSLSERLQISDVHSGNVGAETSVIQLIVEHQQKTAV